MKKTSNKILLGLLIAALVISAALMIAIKMMAI